MRVWLHPGHILTSAMLTHVSFPKVEKGKVVRFPRVLFSNEEVVDIKRVQPEGAVASQFRAVNLNP